MSASTRLPETFRVRIILGEHGGKFCVGIDARLGHGSILPQTHGEEAEQLFLFLTRKRVGGSFAGGWFSSWLMHRGFALNAARKRSLALSASLLAAAIVIAF